MRITSREISNNLAILLAKNNPACYLYTFFDYKVALKRMYRFINYLLFLYFPLLAYSENALPLSNTDGGSPSIINNCVSAISGDFLESSCDLILKGPEALTIERLYSSASNNEEGFFGWRHNQESKIHITYGEENENLYATYANKSGRTAKFSGSWVAEKNGKSNLRYRYVEELGKGYTNIGTGIISARNHLKNVRIQSNFELKELYVKAEHEFCFAKDYSLNSDTGETYKLIEEKRSNGNIFTYNYRNRNITDVRAMDASKRTWFSWIKFENKTTAALQANPIFEIEASDGRKIIYGLKKFWNNYRIEHVVRPNAPYEAYQYDDQARMTKKLMPNNRFLAIEYNDYSSKSSGRVKRLLAPVGRDATPIVTHAFDYLYNNDRFGNLINGATHVYNAKGQLTVYNYLSDLRIDSICKYQGTNLYSKDRFIWSKDGDLLYQYIQDEKNNIIAARSFSYDARGNLTQNCFYGALQGGPIKLSFSERRKVLVPECVNSYSICYKHSDDGRDLLLEEIFPEGKTIRYGYEPARSLMDKKLTFEHGNLKIREFYEYDQNGLLISLIVDDGITEDKNDLTHVTMRKITKTLNQTEIPIGLPILVDEYYVDLTTGCYHLSKRVKNFYSFQGDLISQETYDANVNLRFIEYFEYNAHNKVILEQNSYGEKKYMTYNQNDELETMRIPHQNLSLSYLYDFAGRLIKETKQYDDGTTLCTSYEYDVLGLLIAEIDEFGLKTVHEYDDFGRLSKTCFPTYIDPMGHVITPMVTKKYDTLGNVVKLTDPRGNVVKTTYSARGQPVTIASNGVVESFEYNDEGTIKKSVAKNGLVTFYEHDAFGRLLKKECYSSSGIFLNSTSSTYNSFHKITDTDAKGTTTHYSYNYAGQLVSVTKNDARTEYAYDELQRLHKTKEWTDELNFRVKTNTFDVLNRVVEERLEDNLGNLLSQAKFTYDCFGNKSEVILNQDGRISITKTVFNACNDPVKIIDPEGNTTHFIYDRNAYNKHGQRILKVTEENALGIQTITEMNIYGKPETILKKNTSSAEIFKKEIGYDATGNVVFTLETAIALEKTIRKVLTKFVYNTSNCLIALVEAAGTTEQKFTEFKYNAFDEKIATIKPDGQQILESYDEFQRLKTIKALNQSFSYSYEYDLNGNLEKSIDHVNNQTTYRTYDSSDRMVREVLGTGITVDYTYDRVSRPLIVKLQDESSVCYRYDPLYLRSVERKLNNGTSIFSHDYVKYDLAGHLLEEKNSSKDEFTTYQYHLSGQLASQKSKNFSEEIEYDALHNIIKINKNGTEVKFTYDDLNQLKSEDGSFKHTYVHDSANNCVQQDETQHEINSLNQLLKTKTNIYSYDGNGNRIADGKKQYQYDTLDRLTSLKFDEGEYLYSYDSFNRRLSKTHKQGEKVVEISNYLYFGQNEVGSYDSVGELKEFRTLGTGKGAEIGATVLIEMQEKLFYPRHDHNGNIISLIDAKTSQVFEDYKYSAFGEEKIFDGDGIEIERSYALNPWRFSSKRIDTESGFANFGRRYYDSLARVWISPDPIGFEGGPNLYAYVMNNPLSNIDLYGLEAVGFRERFAEGARRVIHKTQTMVFQRCIDVAEEMVSNAERVINSATRFFNTESEPQITHDKEYEKNSNEKSRITYLTYNKIRIPNVHNCFINGMRTEYLEGMAHAEVISQAAGGVEMVFCYNKTYSTPEDLKESIRNLLGYVATKPVRKLHKIWNKALSSSSDARILQICHSQGVIHVRNALMSFPPELRARIHVLAIAPAAYVNRELCGSVVHYTSERDFVPLIDRKGKRACRDTTIRLKPHADAPVFDHDFQSPTYEKVMQPYISNFIKKYGG